MDEINKTEADAIANLVQRPFIEEVHGTPVLMMPSGDGKWEMDIMASLLPAPTRKTGSTYIHEVDSFIQVSKRHGSLATAAIYLDVDYVTQKISATVVFNDHGEDNAGHQDHRATFKPRMGVEWSRWNERNAKRQSQSDFAEFLEANVSDIASPEGSKLPNGSDVLTFVSRLEETRTVKYGSAINIQNGMVQLEFTEDGDDHTKGKLELFREFAIGVRPFFGGEAYQVRALLRYRIDRNTGGITFWYELQRADKVLEDATQQLITKIQNETGLPVIFGSAP